MYVVPIDHFPATGTRAFTEYALTPILSWEPDVAPPDVPGEATEDAPDIVFIALVVLPG